MTTEVVPPYSVEAEQCVLSCMMQDGAAIRVAMSTLVAADFYNESHSVIFNTIIDMHKRKMLIEILTLEIELDRLMRDESWAGQQHAYLYRLMDAAPTWQGIAHYVKIVQDKSILRQVLAAGDAAREVMAENALDVDTQLVSVKNALATIVRRGGEADTMRPMPPIVKEAMKDTLRRSEEGNATTGTTTGFSDLDFVTQGWQKSDLVVVSARPGIGKTTIAMQFAQASAEAGKTTLVWSMEMPSTDLVKRMLAPMAEVGLHQIRSGVLRDDQWEALETAARKISDLPMFINDSMRSITPMAVKAKIVEMQQKGHNIGLVVIDYLQLMTADRPTGNEVTDLTQISQGIKGVAMDTKVPILCLAQIGREGWLRGSGGIEQAADIVMVLTQDGAWTGQTDQGKKTGKPAPREDASDEEAPTSEALLDVVKHRNGAKVKVKLVFVKRTVKFIGFEDRYTGSDPGEFQEYGGKQHDDDYEPTYR